jgi:hypothetical protein
MHVIVVQPERTDHGMAFGEPVTIRAAGDEESKLGGHAQVMIGGAGRVFGVKTFEAVEPRFSEHWDLVVNAVQSWVCEDRKTAGGVYECDAIECGHFEFWDPGGAILLEETIEGFIDTAAEAAANQSAPHVGPAWRLAFGELKDRVRGEWDPESIQAFGHLPDAVLSNLLESGGFRKEPGMLDIEVIAQEMDFGAIDFGGELSAGNKLDCQALAGDGGTGATFDRIVIGQCDGVEPEARGVAGEFLGSVSAVGKVCVKVQVSRHD